MVLQALVSVFPNGLTDKQLSEQIAGDPSSVLRKLRGRDEDFRAVITRCSDGQRGRPSRDEPPVEWGLSKPHRFA
jgi:hypothetical protein